MAGGELLLRFERFEQTIKFSRKMARWLIAVSVAGHSTAAMVSENISVSCLGEYSSKLNGKGSKSRNLPLLSTIL